jgi:hypothetical protein
MEINDEQKKLIVGNLVKSVNDGLAKIDQLESEMNELASVSLFKFLI